MDRALGYMAGALSPASDSAIKRPHSFGLIILFLRASVSSAVIYRGWTTGSLRSISPINNMIVRWTKKWRQGFLRRYWRKVEAKHGIIVMMF